MAFNRNLATQIAFIQRDMKNLETGLHELMELVQDKQTPLSDETPVVRRVSKMSAAARKRISMAQKRRWEAARKEKK